MPKSCAGNEFIDNDNSFTINILNQYIHMIVIDNNTIRNTCKFKILYWQMNIVMSQN